MPIDELEAPKSRPRLREKTESDWGARERAFRAIVAEARERAIPWGYDCLIPVSLDLDPAWNIAKCIQYGLRGLVVRWIHRDANWSYAAEAEVRGALETFAVDHLDWSIADGVDLRALELNLAHAFRIPLVVLGHTEEHQAAADGPGAPRIIGLADYFARPRAERLGDTGE
jgi:hypothetical protein